MTDATRNLVFLAGFAAYVVIRGVYEARCKGQERVQGGADASERALLVLVTVGCLLLPVLYLATPWLGFADYALPAPVAWIGVTLMLAALWLFRRAHADLGTNWSVTMELHRGHQLVRHGVYRAVRHPMYAAIWLFSLAQGLLLQNWLAGWSAVAAFAVMYCVRVPREERLMREAFGREYADYERQTGRLLPRLRGGPRA